VPLSDGRRPDSGQGRADGRTTDGCGSLLSDQMRLKTVRNEPKLRGSCAPWQKLRGCAKTRKLHKSYAPQHRNFLVGRTGGDPPQMFT